MAGRSLAGSASTVSRCACSVEGKTSVLTLQREGFLTARLLLAAEAIENVVFNSMTTVLSHRRPVRPYHIPAASHSNLEIIYYGPTLGDTFAGCVVCFKRIACLTCHFFRALQHDDARTICSLVVVSQLLLRCRGRFCCLSIEWWPFPLLEEDL
jgi:hypothetical protein